MRRTVLCPKAIYHYASLFVKSLEKEKPCRGRPKTYSPALILAVAGIQNLYGFSFREALEFCGETFDLPALSTFHYRVSTLNPAIVKKFIAFLGMELQHIFLSEKKPIRSFIIDGTGWSFNDIYPLSFLRGTEVRKVQSHVRAIALVATTGKERFFIGVEEGRAYAGEVTLAKTLISRFSFRQNLPFLGDRGFDSIYFLKLVKDRGALPAIRMKEGRHFSIKSPERKESRENEKLYGKGRTLIEGLFGNTKEKTGNHIRVFKEHIAQIFGLLRLALYNMYLLKKKGWVWVIFRTGSRIAIL